MTLVVVYAQPQSNHVMNLYGTVTLMVTLIVAFVQHRINIMTTKFESALFGAITLGADPEIFLTDPSGKPWGARDCSTGTKEEPEPFYGGGLQVDGMALEYNIAPAETIDQWIDYHSDILDRMEQRAIEQDLQICDASLLDFTDYIAEGEPTEDELIFGCDPDLNAGTGCENKMPDNDGSIKFRTTGGHVHVGMCQWGILDHNQLETARVLVKMLDATLGLWSVLNDDGLERKKLYGKAGAFRVKPYGFEYRTLSNFWVFKKSYMEYVFTTVTKVMTLPTTLMFSIASRIESIYPQIEQAINTNDRDLARKLLAEVELFINA